MAAIVKSRDLKHHDILTCDHLAAFNRAALHTPSATATKGATHSTMTHQTVERDQRRTMCEHLAVTEDHLTTEKTPSPRQEDSRRTQKSVVILS